MQHEAELCDVVRATEWLMEVLAVVRGQELSDWAITSGVIRNVVWDHLHGYEKASPIKDVDVAFFDTHDLSRERDRRIENGLQARAPEVPWEVTNQAGVHLWYERKFGHPMEPIRSLEDGIGRYPETATSVGIRLEEDNVIRVIAPCGLEDLFGMILRRNRRQVTQEYFLQRLRDKRIEERWPKVLVIKE